MPNRRPELKQTYCRDHGGKHEVYDHVGCPDCAKDLDEELALSVPPELDAITALVLAYRPKPKSKAAKKRVRRAVKESRGR
jgi:hypothetical protein